MQAAMELSEVVGKAAVCRSLATPRASFLPLVGAEDGAGVTPTPGAGTE